MKVLFKLFLVLFFASFSYHSYSQQYRNLVLEGGGIRGMAYIGAIQVLEETHQMNYIERVSGTSVGAITAALLAVGYDSHEINKIISELEVNSFNDGKGIFIGGSMRMNEHYGWYKGIEIKEWMDNLLLDKTGVKNMTFRQLREYSKENDEALDLYIHATNLSLQNSVVLSNETYPDMIISDAVRVSASIPLYFTAAFMDVNGKVYYEPESQENLYIMADGGLISNYPIDNFDHVRYNPEVEYLGYNPETLGLRLDRDEQIKADVMGSNELASYEINDIQGYVGAFYNFVNEHLNRCELKEEDWLRTVSISTCGISPKIRKMEKEEKDVLIQAGEKSMREFLEKN